MKRGRKNKQEKKEKRLWLERKLCGFELMGFSGVIGENVYCCMNKGIKKNQPEKEKKYWDVNERFKECSGRTGGKKKN